MGGRREERYIFEAAGEIEIVAFAAAAGPAGAQAAALPALGAPAAVHRYLSARLFDLCFAGSLAGLLGIVVPVVSIRVRAPSWAFAFLLFCADAWSAWAAGRYWGWPASRVVRWPAGLRALRRFCAGVDLGRFVRPVRRPAQMGDLQRGAALWAGGAGGIRAAGVAALGL